MSEYQYYEFRTVDRPLNDRQMRELRAISTRAEISEQTVRNQLSTLYEKLGVSSRLELAAKLRGLGDNWT